MNKRAPLVLFAIVLAIIGVVALVFWDSIRAEIVTPLSTFILMMLDFLSSFDQIFLWAALLFFLIMGTITGLGKTKPVDTPNRMVNMKISSAGRLRFWETQVYLLTRGRIPSRYSIHEVRRLLVAVMGYKLHLDTAEAEARLKSGELVIPPQYEEFSALDQDPDSDQHEDQLTEFIKSLISTLRGKQQQLIQEREKVLADLILYMEKQLEIEHDH